MAGRFLDGITIRVNQSTSLIILTINEDGTTRRTQHRIVLQPFYGGLTCVSEAFSPSIGRGCRNGGTNNVGSSSQMWKVEVVCQLISDSGTGLLLYPSGPLSTRREIFLDPFRMVASFMENKKVFQRGTRLMCGEIGASALQRSTRNNPVRFCLTSEYRQKKAEVTCELKAMDLLTDTERRLTVERLLKYQGTAKIDLNQISLQPLISREID
ncbi:hypothetical protein BDV23DRAFT_69202 [Aspergillus alliaceus]|uniref:Uncharacterized protein n=1 Tax=Petromyces alliaceus TaxID=209559 RepID=A0A5N7CDD5_PETAA|nr:hypothetical protein BDV23DRAFT_69202 [Aspergillus alliaceus]